MEVETRDEWCDCGKFCSEHTEKESTVCLGKYFKVFYE